MDELTTTAESVTENHISDSTPADVDSKHDTPLSEQEVNNAGDPSVRENTDAANTSETDNGSKDNTAEYVVEQEIKCTEESGESSEIPTIKKNKRRVYFPEDNIVHSYFEPPDPWKDTPNWRTADLLQAYRKSCERHSTKPLNKVLQQLQCIENVGERYEILSLKGEKLDLRQCESLEDIFRHVRFRCVDLEGTHLDDEMAVAIFEMVEYYESACKLNISFNKGIGPRGWQSCSRLVRKTPCLTFIDARNCDLNERVIPIFGRALRMGCFLQRLQLQNTNLAGRALLILVAALKANEILKELFIGDNKLMPTDGVQIGNLLKYNHSLELLDLRNNHLQDVGVNHICDGLAEQILDSGLLTLVLWNNQVTFQGMHSINRALLTAVHLETINLGRNPLTNEGVHILKDGLLKAKGLLKLGLSGSKISCEGAVALAEVIADNTRLVRLDLQENDIKTAGLMALSLALKVNENITRLDVDRDTKKESGVKDYADQQRKLQKDIAQLLERNRDLTREREQRAEQLRESQRELDQQVEDVKQTTEILSEQALLDTHAYIPSGDKIERPKLLFTPQTFCPEHELDSPIGGDEFVLESLEGNSLLPAPSVAGVDILSPQYCPDAKLTAKRIFSVTKVTSPTTSFPLHYDASTFQPLPVLTSPMTLVTSPSTVATANGPVGDVGGTLDGSSSAVPLLCAPLPTADLKPNLPVPIYELLGSSNASLEQMGDSMLVSEHQNVHSENIEVAQKVDSAKVDGNDDSANAKDPEVKLERSETGSTDGNNSEKDVTGGNLVQDNVENITANNTEHSAIGTDSEINQTCDKTSLTRQQANIGEQNASDSNRHAKENVSRFNVVSAGEVQSVDSHRKEDERPVIGEAKDCDETFDSGCGEDGSTRSIGAEGIGAKSGNSSSDSVPCESDDSARANAQNLNSNNCACTDSQEILDNSSEINVTSSETHNNNRDCDKPVVCKNTDNDHSETVPNDDIKTQTNTNGDLDENDEENMFSFENDSTVTKVPSSKTSENGGSGDNSLEIENSFEAELVNIKTDNSTDDKCADNDKDGLESIPTSLESEPWNQVVMRPGETTEPQAVMGPTTVKPDFHTNLSLNGLRQELASIIDEESPTLGTTGKGFPSNTNGHAQSVGDGDTQ